MKKTSLTISPHVTSPVDTAYMMKGVIKSLLPAVAASVYFFKTDAIKLLVVSVISCVLTELAMQKIRGKEIRIKDLSAVLTGILFAMVLPPSIPVWMIILGSVVAIALGKEVFGGLGTNIFNPALLGRAFLMAAFPIALTTWTQPITLDAVTQATPLGIAKFEHTATATMSLLMGNIGGSLGETSAIALLLGLVYLLAKKIIDYRVPLAYAATVTIFSGVAYLINREMYLSPIFNLLAGGFLLGAIYMATDPVTSPITKKGRWIFGAGCGLMTMTIRLWGGLPEGVMYSILLMNAFTPLINRITRSRRYGVNGGRT
jgi:H+/Na+-translocating ferredoxin:NAD+ oxidoreductase subunit D